MYSLLRPLLFALPSEGAHDFTLGTLKRLHSLGLTRMMFGSGPASPCQVMGLEFSNAVGLAAGMDKNGSYVDALGALGFGFIEVGTITPRPQVGNPKPRIFRLPKAQALINRMGFNNAGVDVLVENVRRRRYKGVLGISIGKNADTPMDKAVDDYVTCMRKVYAHADYIAVNISSPNTKDLRNLQQGSELVQLLDTLKEQQVGLEKEHGKYVPLAVKIAPDLEDEAIGLIAKVIEAHEMDGVIATNTTVGREGVVGLPHSTEQGGLSGAPITTRSTKVIRELHDVLGDRIPIIGVGGIMSGKDAVEKQAAGAKLIQIYTGLIYRGPALVKEAVEAMRLAKRAIGS